MIYDKLSPWITEKIIGWLEYSYVQSFSLKPVNCLVGPDCRPEASWFQFPKIIIQPSNYDFLWQPSRVIVTSYWPEMKAIIVSSHISISSSHSSHSLIAGGQTGESQHMLTVLQIKHFNIWRDGAKYNWMFVSWTGLPPSSYIPLADHAVI